MLDRNERRIISWANDKTAASRLVASAQPEQTTIDIQMQTPETSAAFTISRASLRELADFLAAVAAEVGAWEDVTEQPEAPADEAEGTVA